MNLLRNRAGSCLAKWILPAVLVVTSGAQWAIPETRGQTPAARQALKTYLKKHQLFQLYANLLEDELLNATSDGQQTTARALADWYAWELNTYPERFEKIGNRLDELAASYPHAIPLNTQIRIAFGRYRRAKGLFEKWNGDPEKDTQKKQVQSGFADIVQRTTDAVARLDQQRLDPELSESQRQELLVAASQFRYLAGWARYYRSITLDEPVAQRTLLETAEQEFLDLLDLPDAAGLLERTPQWWSLDSEWTCRLLLGLGMTSQALGQSRSAEYCFQLLSESRVPASIRLNRRVWQFHSFIFPGQMQSAADLVQRCEADRLAQGDVPFWSAVAIAGVRCDPQNSQAANLTRAGFSSLAKANEFRIIDEILEQHSDVHIAGSDFFARWMDGYAALKQNDRPSTPASAKPPTDLIARARRSLGLALDYQGGLLPVYRARCRYHYGFALQLSGQFEEAADQFREASTVLKNLDPSLSEHAAWMQCQSLNQLANRDTAWQSSLNFALSEFQKQYPSSLQAAQAAFLQVMIQLDQQPPQEALQTLKSVAPDDANYPRALFETVRLCHRIWSATPQAHERKSAAAETLAAALQFAERVGVDAEDAAAVARFVRVSLLACDVCLQTEEVEPAQNWLSRCTPLVSRLPDSGELHSDYYFLSLAIATTRLDEAGESEASDWLLRNTTNPQHLRAALIARARMLDRRWMASTSSAEPRPDPREMEPVIDAYQRLLDEFPSDENRLAQEAVARTALLRMAELQLAAGQASRAREGFARLQRAMPDQLVYLQGLARAETRLSEWDRAAEHWRRIASGSTAGSPDWLEAKYNLIQCLQPREPGKAKAVLDQVLLLVPQLPAPFDQQFADLRSRMVEIP